MIFIGSQNEKIGSKLIRYGTDSDVSHFAVGFGSGANPRVIESVLDHGVQVVTLDQFKSHQTIRRLIQVPLPPKEDNYLFDLVLDRLQGKKYDNNAIAYWTVRLFLHRYLWVPMPKSNQWGDKNKFYCVEVLEALKPWLADRGVVFDKEIEMIHPGEALDKYLSKLRV